MKPRNPNHKCMYGGIPSNVGFPSVMNSNNLPEQFMSQSDYKSKLAEEITE